MMKPYLKVILVLLFLASLIPATQGILVHVYAMENTPYINHLPEQVIRKDLMYAGRQRHYYLYVPHSISTGEPVPLILAFHGFKGDGARLMNATGLNTIADKHGVIIVYPDAVVDRWNTNSGPSDATSEDVGFVKAILDRVEANYPVDTHRIYATGFSSGGFFTQRLACELSDRIASFGPNASTMGVPLSNACHPPRPVSIMMINGTDDPIVTWDGEIRRVKRDFPDSVILSVPQTVDFWRKVDQCPTPPVNQQLPDKDPKDGTRVQVNTSEHCKGSTEVVQMIVDHGGHTWPGSAPGNLINRALLGKTTQDIQLGEVLWTFFQRNPLP